MWGLYWVGWWFGFGALAVVLGFGLLAVVLVGMGFSFGLGGIGTELLSVVLALDYWQLYWRQ